MRLCSSDFECVRLDFQGLSGVEISPVSTERDSGLDQSHTLVTGIPPLIGKVSVSAPSASTSSTKQALRQAPKPLNPITPKHLGFKLNPETLGASLLNPTELEPPAPSPIPLTLRPASERSYAPEP